MDGQCATKQVPQEPELVEPLSAAVPLARGVTGQCLSLPGEVKGTRKWSPGSLAHDAESWIC